MLQRMLHTRENIYFITPTIIYEPINFKNSCQAQRFEKPNLSKNFAVFAHFENDSRNLVGFNKSTVLSNQVGLLYCVAP